jgi:hypothetical protein
MKKQIFKKAIKYFGNQAKFADYFGFTRQFITNIKNGRSKFPKNKLDELCKLIGVKNEAIN